MIRGKVVRTVLSAVVVMVGVAACTPEKKAQDDRPLSEQFAASHSQEPVVAGGSEPKAPWTEEPLPSPEPTGTAPADVVSGSGGNPLVALKDQKLAGNSGTVTLSKKSFKAVYSCFGKGQVSVQIGGTATSGQCTLGANDGHYQFSAATEGRGKPVTYTVTADAGARWSLAIFESDEDAGTW